MIGELFVNLATGTLLAFVAERVTEYLVGWPLERFAPQVDREFLRYVVLPAGAALSWFSQLNIFSVEAIPVEVGLILTAVVVGCGPQIIHQLVTEPTVPAVGELPF